MKSNSEVTLKSLSEKLSISVSTISRVLSGKADKYRISKTTQEKILNAASELNFSPNQIARGLRLQKTLTLGLIIPSISNPFFASIAQSIENEARKSGYSILISDSQENTEIEIETLNIMRSRKVDGIIVSSVGQNCDHLVKVYKSGFPLLVIDRYFPSSKIPYVGTDNFKGAYEGVELLIKSGHKKIACIQGLENSAPNNDRVKGYKKALLKYKIIINDNLIVGNDFSEQNGYIETKLLLQQDDRPTAIFACGNQISLGVIRAVRENKLKIPTDISLLTFDEHPYSEYLSPSLTTIAQQKEEIGQIAVRMLLNQIEGKPKGNSSGILLAPKVINRKSIKRLK